MGATLFEPPPKDPSKSAIESILDLTPVTDIGPVCPYAIPIPIHLFKTDPYDLRTAY